MAEKNDTEARCPACRTPYDKDRVLKVAAANSERLLVFSYVICFLSAASLCFHIHLTLIY